MCVVVVVEIIKSTLVQRALFSNWGYAEPTPNHDTNNVPMSVYLSMFNKTQVLTTHQQRQPHGSELLSPLWTGHPRASRRKNIRPKGQKQTKIPEKGSREVTHTTGKRKSPRKIPHRRKQCQDSILNPLCRSQGESPPLDSGSGRNWSRIVHRGRTATKNRPSHIRPAGEPSVCVCVFVCLFV